MENLTEKENELRKLAEGGDYWDILYLADFLYDQKRYAEAKEQYLKIAGEDDLSGDGNSHLFQLLLDIGEYEEALKYYDYVQNCCDTSPAEGAYTRFEAELLHPESRIWAYIDNDMFDECLQIIDDIDSLDDAYLSDDYVDRGKFDLETYLEPILLMRANSEDEKIRKSAKLSLLMMYSEGNYFFGETGMVDFSAKKDVEKAIEFSIVFAEYPELIDEIYCDWSYFNTILVNISDDYEENGDEYIKRLVITVLKCAEQIGNVDEVFDMIQRALFQHYDYTVPFCLGYLPKGISRVSPLVFSGNKELESIVIPDTIKTINAYAFSYCASLESVEIPSSVTEIEEFAFSDCTSLASITIPKTVTEMGCSVFEYCDSLVTIYCEAESKPDGWSDYWLGDDCEAEVIWGHKK